MFEKRILHRDISVSNIIISAADGHEGLLIDLDYATSLDGYKPLVDDMRTVSADDRQRALRSELKISSRVLRCSCLVRS